MDVENVDYPTVGVQLQFRLTFDVLLGADPGAVVVQLRECVSVDQYETLAALRYHHVIQQSCWGREFCHYYPTKRKWFRFI